VSRYQKGKTNLDFTEAKDSEWQWHQLGHMQVCTSLQIDNHTSTPPLRFLQAYYTNNVKSKILGVFQINKTPGVLVLTDQAVFLLQHEQMHRKTQLKTMPLLSALIRVGNKQMNTVCANVMCVEMC